MDSDELNSKEEELKLKSPIKDKSKSVNFKRIGTKDDLAKSAEIKPKSYQLKLIYSGIIVKSPQTVPHKKTADSLGGSKTKLTFSRATTIKSNSTKKKY